MMRGTIGESVYIALMIGAVTVALTILVLFYQYAVRTRWHLRHVPRPSSGGSTFFFGHMRVIGKGAPGEVVKNWLMNLGPVVSFHGFMGTARITLTDKAALHHVLITDPYNFPKPTLLRRTLITLVGEGILVTEGSTHQRQRKIMNPSFGAPHMKSMYPLFIDKAIKLRDQILHLMNESKMSVVPLDIYDYANRATLDVIGSAGFGYEANATSLGMDSELFSAFHHTLSTFGPMGKLGILKRLIPALKTLLIFHKTKGEVASDHSMSVLNRIGTELIQEKRMAVTGDMSGNKQVEASQMAGRDLLSTLIRANMAVDLKPQQKMSDAEILAQIHTFMLAGNDTTANSLSWAVYALCKHPSTQNTLRAEILSYPTDTPTFDELNALPYLDAVVRETLRLYAPVVGTSRVVSRDCVLPISDGWVDTKGVRRDSIFIPKNTMIYIPILPLQKSTSKWGSDAEEFKPERWLKGKNALPEGVMEIPSVAFPTFIAGPRGCIGFRFSLIEMKTMLFSLLRVMNFELAVPIDDIEGKANVVTRPSVKSRPQDGLQLPVLLTLVDPIA